LLREQVSAIDARSALAPLSVERALGLGVLRRVAGNVESTVRILPAGDLVITCDRTPEGSPDLPGDHVMGVASSSILLASLTVRRPIATALDVGAGSGIQSVLAAGHAERVIACDINPRALNFTAFNARLNGKDNVECRSGSFFGPVTGEMFDLVVSNPPFVISPENGLVFRDSGLRGDDVSRTVLRQAAAHLNEDGLAFVLISWGVRKGEAWPDRLRPWVADLPCDIWFLHHSGESPLLYAASWNTPLQSRAKEYAAALDRWTEYLAGLGFSSVAYGAAILRKRSGTRNWVRFDDIGEQREPASGEQIAELIETQDYLASLGDDRRLLDARLAVDPAHRLEQIMRCRDGNFEVETASLRRESGLRFTTPLDAFSAHLLTRLEGRTLGEAVRASAEHFASDAIGYSEFESSALQFAKLTLALGFTRLVSPETSASVPSGGRLAGGGDGDERRAGDVAT
ncbi:MAG TPA: methyltransferase, partial [Candidatus Limnocylindria bacterium]|nr:methyltransferase [Candidatus Limnocylindria bacterium]